MNPHPVIAATLLVFLSPANARAGAEKPPGDAVLDAIAEFNRRSRLMPNEVTVVLEPETSIPDSDSAPAETEPGVAEDSEAEPQDTAAAELPPVLEPPPSLEPRTGLAIKVEKLTAGSGIVNPDEIRLSAPFPAKPLSSPMSGWRLESIEMAPAFTREVEIAPGTMISLNIRPHCLIPKVDGVSSFSIPEPGFEPSLGYNQTGTVGAVLAESIDHLDRDVLRMGVVIDQLQQLLVSLPKPADGTETETSSQ
jgi:hypothetical protein